MCDIRSPNKISSFGMDIKGGAAIQDGKLDVDKDGGQVLVKEFRSRQSENDVDTKYGREGKVSGKCEYQCQADGSCQVQETYKNQTGNKIKTSSSLSSCHPLEYNEGSCKGVENHKGCESCREVCDEKSPNKMSKFDLVIKGHVSKAGIKGAELGAGVDEKQALVKVFRQKEDEVQGMVSGKCEYQCQADGKCQIQETYKKQTGKTIKTSSSLSSCHPLEYDGGSCKGVEAHKECESCRKVCDQKSPNKMGEFEIAISDRSQNEAGIIRGNAGNSSYGSGSAATLQKPSKKGKAGDKSIQGVFQYKLINLKQAHGIALQGNIPTPLKQWE